MPHFSVVIPLYNKAAFIKYTLQSVLQQTYTDFELIVVDDGSTDNSGAAVQTISDARLQYIKTDNNGVSAARNIGISLAKSKWITFLDADDLWKPDFLAAMHNAIHKFPEYRVFSGAIEKQYPHKTLKAAYSVSGKTLHKIVNYFEASMKETIICTSCAVFSKEVFQKVGNFDQTLPSGQDTDLWIRIGLSYPVVFVNSILATYVKTPQSLSSRQEHLSKKADFSRFNEQAAKYPSLKKFIDYNLFSLALQAKVSLQDDLYSTLKSQLNGSAIPLWKKVILRLPTSMLILLRRLKLFF
jgi:glycosyltransferase involved in cell wall biosynthesis